MLPIIGEHFGIIANVRGGIGDLPEVVKLDVNGKTTTIFLCLERSENLLEKIGVNARRQYAS